LITKISLIGDACRGPRCGCAGCAVALGSGFGVFWLSGTGIQFESWDQSSVRVHASQYDSPKWQTAANEHILQPHIRKREVSCKYPFALLRLRFGVQFRGSLVVKGTVFPEAQFARSHVVKEEHALPCNCTQSPLPSPQLFVLWGIGIEFGFVPPTEIQSPPTRRRSFRRGKPASFINCNPPIPLWTSRIQ